MGVKKFNVTGPHIASPPMREGEPGNEALFLTLPYWWIMSM